MLKKGEYPVASAERMPRSLKAEDFEHNDIVICLNLSDHEPMIQQRFSDYREEVVYWEVADVDELEPETAFQLIVFETGQFIFLLNASQTHRIVPEKEQL